MSDRMGKTVTILGLLAAAWLAVRYLLPLLMPFLFGLLLALASEPAVQFGEKKLGIKRPWSAGLGVGLTIFLSIGILSFFGALAVKELGALAGALPDISHTVQRGMEVAQDWMIGLADDLPENARSFTTAGILELFDGGSVLLTQLTERLSRMIGGALGRVPEGALGLFTGILSGFMISARLPGLRRAVKDRLPRAWTERYLPALRRTRKTLGSWLKAQGKLAGVTFCIVTAGLLLLRIRYAPALGLLIALVDAVPVLGTGTVLIPWAAVCLLQEQTLRGVGLLVIYGAALVTRTALEPRFVGKQLGLDPLLTLICVYVGYRLWGFLGMILSPILVSAVKSLRFFPAPPGDGQ